MLYREIIAVCSEIRTEHINNLCGQNVKHLIAKPGVRWSNIWNLEGQNASSPSPIPTPLKSSHRRQFPQIPSGTPAVRIRSGPTRQSRVIESIRGLLIPLLANQHQDASQLSFVLWPNNATMVREWVATPHTESHTPVPPSTSSEPPREIKKVKRRKSSVMIMVKSNATYCMQLQGYKMPFNHVTRRPVLANQFRLSFNSQGTSGYRIQSELNPRNKHSADLRTSAFLRPKVFIIQFTSVSHWPLSWAYWPCPHSDILTNFHKTPYELCPHIYV